MPHCPNSSKIPSKNRGGKINTCNAWPLTFLALYKHFNKKWRRSIHVTHDHSLSWLCTSTSIKSGGVKVVLWGLWCLMPLSTIFQLYHRSQSQFVILSQSKNFQWDYKNPDQGIVNSSKQASLSHGNVTCMFSPD